MELNFATEQDFAEMANIINKAYRENVGWTVEDHLVGGERITVEDLKKISEDQKSHFIVAKKDGLLLGTIQVEEQEEEGVVHFGLFAVRPTEQNQNIGKKLLEFAEKFTKETLHKKEIYMYVISIRTELIAYYERRGFSKTDRHFDFPEAYQQYLKVEGIKMQELKKVL